MINDIFSTKTLRVNVSRNGNNALEGYKPTRMWGFKLYFEPKNQLLKGSLVSYMLSEYFNNLLLRYSYRTTEKKNIHDFIFWVNSDPENIEFLNKNGIEKLNENNIGEIFVYTNNEQILGYTNKEKNLFNPEFKVDMYKAVRYAKKAHPGHRELITAEDRGEAISKCTLYFKGITFNTKKPVTDEQIKEQLARVADIFTVRGEYSLLSKDGFITFANKRFAKECGIKIEDIEDMQIIINDMKNKLSKGIVVTNEPEDEAEAY